MGYYLHEAVAFDDQGRLLTTGTWLYKPPSALDIPLDFNVTLIPKDPNPAGVLQSKATGERTCVVYSRVFSSRACVLAVCALSLSLERFPPT